MCQIFHIIGEGQRQQHPRRQRPGHARCHLPQRASAAQRQHIQHRHQHKHQQRHRHEAELAPEVDEAVRYGDDPRHKVQRPAAHGDHQQRQADGYHEPDGEEKNFQLIQQDVLGLALAEGLAQRVQQAAGGPHGEPDGKHQAEPHELAAGVAGNVFQIAPYHLRHVPRHNLLQAGDDAVHIQFQNTQQGADEDQQRENSEQQVVGQGCAVPCHVMEIVPADHLRRRLPQRRAGVSAFTHSSLLSVSAYYCSTAVSKIKGDFPLHGNLPPVFYHKYSKSVSFL